MDIIIPTLLAVSQWFSALFVVCTPFIKMALIWFAWQTGIGWLAWSTARFYSNHCAAPGINGFISSLFSMGSPICISAWFSHAAFVIAYITAFIAAVLLVILWLWKHVTRDKNIVLLRQQISSLQKQINGPLQGNNSRDHGENTGEDETAL